MKRWLLALGFVVSVAGVWPAWSASALQGTIQNGERPEPNAVVWLDAPDASKPVRPPKVVLAQRNLDFSPHVLAVRVGTIVDFPNDDRVFHNVFSFHDGKRFDLGLYPVGTVKYQVFDHPGLSRIFCNIHPNMAAYIMAVDTPYFSVSDERGRFTLGAVAPGTYTYHAWKAGRRDLTGSAVIELGKALELRWP